MQASPLDLASLNGVGVPPHVGTMATTSMSFQPQALDRESLASADGLSGASVARALVHELGSNGDSTSAPQLLFATARGTPGEHGESPSHGRLVKRVPSAMTPASHSLEHEIPASQEWFGATFGVHEETVVARTRHHAISNRMMAYAVDTHTLVAR